jgi:subtilisin family serine protease
MVFIARKMFAALVATAVLFSLPLPARANPEEKGGFNIGISIDLLELAKKKKKKVTSGTSAKKTSGTPAKSSGKAAGTPAKSTKKKTAAKLADPKSGVPPKGEIRFRVDEVLFILKPTAPETALSTVVTDENLTRIAEAELALLQRTVHRYAITDGRSVAQVVAALEANRNIEQAQPDYVYDLMEGEVIGFSGLQYAHKQLHVEAAHLLSTGEGVGVAIIDSRVDTKHPALAGAVLASYSSVDTPSEQPDGHGTAMAGAVAAKGQLTGVAPGAKLLVAECFSRDKEGRMNGVTYNILKSVDWAFGQQAAVQNLSFAGPRDPMLSRLMKEAAAKGTVFFAAAGNGGPKSVPLYPGADENVIAVTAVDKADVVFARANRGRHIAVAAPGVDVVVLAPGNAADLSTGTSIATAHLSGLAALAIGKVGKIDEKQFRALLKTSAKKLKSPREAVGAGLADAVKLLEDATALSPAKSAQQQ